MPAVPASVRPPAVVEAQVLADRRARVGQTGVGAQVELLVYHRFAGALAELLLWNWQTGRVGRLEAA